MLAEVDESWLSRRYYGGDLSPDAERLLHLAAANYADDVAAEGFLAQAAELAPDHRAVDLGFYKFHFYKHNLTAALGYAERMIVHALKALHLHNRDWRTLDETDAAFAEIEPAPRFLLFSLTARGYLLLRLGEMDDAQETLGKVAELDPKDRFGARRLLAVAAKAGRDEDDEEDGVVALSSQPAPALCEAAA